MQIVRQGENGVGAEGAAAQRASEAGEQEESGPHDEHLEEASHLLVLPQVSPHHQLGGANEGEERHLGRVPAPQALQKSPQVVRSGLAADQ